MKKLVLLACGFVAACNYDTGECYLRADEGAGAGGGAIIPTGYGGFGDVPPKPQGGPAPVDPCSQKAECTVTWKADSAVCSDRGTTGSCTTLFQGNYLTLSDAQSDCARTVGVGTSSGAESCGSCQWAVNAQSKCTDKCYDEHDKGHEKCNGLKDKQAAAKCHQAVNEQLGTCISNCKKK